MASKERSTKYRQRKKENKKLMQENTIIHNQLDYQIHLNQSNNVKLSVESNSQDYLTQSSNQSIKRKNNDESEYEPSESESDENYSDDCDNDDGDDDDIVLIEASPSIKPSNQR